MELSQILSHFAGVSDNSPVVLSPEEARQFHEEQNCRVSFCGLPAVKRVFLEEVHHERT